jgi:UPF0716 family protein affecting phage T7 exclusion
MEINYPEIALSFFIGVSIGFFYFFSLRLVAGLAGFLVIRWILIRTFKPHKRAEREE